MNVVAIFTPLAIEGAVVDTPFGPAGPLRTETIDGWQVLFIQRGGDARARVVAAKERGALHVIGLGAMIALQPDLLPGAWLAPSDAIDQTRGAPTTFFVGRGLGYLSQSPPFCPETRAALVNVVGDQSATAVAAPERALTPAEVKAWGFLGGSIAMSGLAPEWYLCRELEIGYAPLCYVSWTAKETSTLTDSLVRPIIQKVVATLPIEHSWIRSNSAARRELGKDWHQWIASG